MIIIKLKGGLGNQLFQYCFAKSLALEYGEELFGDLSFFNHGLARHLIYGLHPFNIKCVVGNYPFFNIDSKFKFLFDFIYSFRDNQLIRNFPFTKVHINYLENNSEHKIKFYFKEPEIIYFNSVIEDDFYSFDNINLPAYFEGYFQFYSDSKEIYTFYVRVKKNPTREVFS